MTGGFGGHVSFRKHQSFIPACNSTTVRGEMARLGRTEVRFPEKLKCQTFEWKTDLADIMSTNHHHLSCQPFRSTIIVYYHGVFSLRPLPLFPVSTAKSCQYLFERLPNAEFNTITNKCSISNIFRLTAQNPGQHGKHWGKGRVGIINTLPSTITFISIGIR